MAWTEITPAAVGEAKMVDWKTTKSVMGTLISVKKDVGPNLSTIYTVENEGTEYSFWGSSLLDERLSSVKVGEKVKVVLTGEAKGKSGRTYRTFSVYRDSDIPAQTDINEDIPF